MENLRGLSLHNIFAFKSQLERKISSY